MKIENGEMDLADVAAELEKGNRVLLMVRHAERPKMDRNDPSFGAALPITPAGERMSEAFGAKLADYARETQFLASPLLRTRLTAAGIARGMGLGAVEIPTAEELGNSTPYFADARAVFELFRDGGFFEKTFAYFATGRQTGFNDLRAATERLDAWCAARFTGRLGIFATHDLYACAFLCGKGAVTRFTEANWTRFLDAAAVIYMPDGARRYALVRTGLSDGISGV